MDEKLQRIIDLIQKSDLDQTIKDILVRDLQSEGLTDFLKEQILAYCARTKEEIESARQVLEAQPKNPAE